MGLRFTWTADHLNTQNLLRVFKDILSISVQAKLLMIHLPPLPKSEAIGMPPHLENVCLWFLKETELGPQFMWPGISSDIGLVFGFINLNVFQTHILNLSRTENLRQICKLEGETGCCHMVQITMISIFDARRQESAPSRWFFQPAWPCPFLLQTQHHSWMWLRPTRSSWNKVRNCMMHWWTVTGSPWTLCLQRSLPCCSQDMRMDCHQGFFFFFFVKLLSF